MIACKYYIFKMKIKESVQNFEHFISFLDSRIKVENEVAFLKNKLKRHQMKWSFYNFFFCTMEMAKLFFPFFICNHFNSFNFFSQDFS